MTLESETGGGERPSLRVPVTRVVLPVWTKILPFFLSAVLFVSGALSIFAPLPFLFMGFVAKKRWLSLAYLTNAAIVAALLGWQGSVVFGATAVLASWIFLTVLDRSRSVERAFAWTLGLMCFFSAVCVLVYAHSSGVNPVAWVEGQVTRWVDSVALLVPSDQQIPAADLEEWKRSFVIEFPSALGIFCLFVLWLNFTLLFKLNPGNLREKLRLDTQLLSRWKSPEWLVWPTIASGALVIWGQGRLGDVGLNAFKFLMAIYFLHGLSIMSFLFETWRLRGIIRTLLSLAAIMVALPFVLSLGFFDLWFDIRGKLLRQA